MIIFYASLTESKLYIDRNFCFCSLLDSQDLEQWLKEGDSKYLLNE